MKRRLSIMVPKAAVLAGALLVSGIVAIMK